MKAVDAIALKEMMSRRDDFLLIDIREPHENAAFDIGGKLMPMSELMERLDEIPTDKPVVLYCQKGIRTVIIIQRLHQRGGYNNLINLTGGVAAWMKQFPGEQQKP
ncbi:MAG: rhodanese-like domain-containing protein [Sphingobacteriaceae bacterium]|nr:MAG: rhodanese-like domain-containing protein [Sphingobacteriaceae bacterium]